MDFTSVTLFLILYYIRPQEWIKIVATLKPVTVSMALAIIAMLLRYRGFTWRDFFKTPHDYWMTGYLLWIVLAAPNSIDAFRSVYPFFFFYVVTVQALSSMRRAQTFLYWWTFMMWLVAALAVASEYGFDPMGSYDKTHDMFQNRLVLNTSIFLNPNALGHGIYPGVLLLYFALIWKRPIFMKIFAIPFIALQLYCIYLTLSKGAFLCCFVTIIAALMFGRPRVVQLLILLAALTVGLTALKTLPRMNELQRSQTDQAIQGRIAASKFGYESMQSHFRGLGFGTFNESFYRTHKYMKAAHSSYVQIGAELGLPGMFIFWGIIYCCFRTLFIAKPRDRQEERVRRMLFVLIFSYCISSWMVDFGFRATLFLFCASIAAYHRMLLVPKADEESAHLVDQPWLTPTPVTSGKETNAGLATVSVNASDARSTVLSQTNTAVTIDVDPKQEPLLPIGLSWNRFRWQDLVTVCVITYCVIRFWRWIIGNM